MENLYRRKEKQEPSDSRQSKCNHHDPINDLLIKSFYCHPTWSAGVPPIKFLAPLLPGYSNLLSINLLVFNVHMVSSLGIPCLVPNVLDEETRIQLFNSPFNQDNVFFPQNSRIKRSLQGHRFQILRTSIAGQEEYTQLCLGSQFDLSDCSWKGVGTTALPWTNPEMGFC
ncbi:hypothetical protein H5410_058880 [Solanum commersonii]|uniref:Uncharacterized protein n=1 Tax=Solanum commersonii TaxID=4109 RepID=A0A9J5W112_SOLCO|nr:hypothetical protein H5410_058880 [Solanum commersonii]